MYEHDSKKKKSFFVGGISSLSYLAEICGQQELLVLAANISFYSCFFMIYNLMMYLHDSETTALAQQKG